MTDSLVVAGEALIDLVAAPDGALVGHPGGGPYNVARTIGRLEQPVAYLEAASRSTVSAPASGDSSRTMESASTRSWRPTLPPRLRSSSWTPRKRRVPLLRRGDAAGPHARGSDGGAARADRGALRRNARLGLRADGDDPGAARRAGRRRHARRSRPELPARRHRGQGCLPRSPRACAPPHRRAEDERGRPRVAPARQLRDGRRSCPAGGRRGRRARHAGRPRRADRARRRRCGRGRGPARRGCRHDRRRRRVHGCVPRPLALARTRPAELGRREELIEATSFACRVAARTCARAGAEPPRRAELDG